MHAPTTTTVKQRLPDAGAEPPTGSPLSSSPTLTVKFRGALAGAFVMVASDDWPAGLAHRAASVGAHSGRALASGRNGVTRVASQPPRPRLEPRPTSARNESSTRHTGTRRRSAISGGVSPSRRQRGRTARSSTSRILSSRSSMRRRRHRIARSLSRSTPQSSQTWSRCVTGIPRATSSSQLGSTGRV